MIVHDGIEIEWGYHVLFLLGIVYWWIVYWWIVYGWKRAGMMYMSSITMVVVVVVRVVVNVMVDMVNHGQRMQGYFVGGDVLALLGYTGVNGIEQHRGERCVCPVCVCVFVGVGLSVSLSHTPRHPPTPTHPSPHTNRHTSTCAYPQALQQQQARVVAHKWFAVLLESAHPTHLVVYLGVHIMQGERCSWVCFGVGWGGVWYVVGKHDNM